MNKKDKMQIPQLSYLESPTKIEEIRVRMKLDKNTYEPLKNVVEELCGPMPPVCEGDTVNVTYDFFVQYFDVVERRLHLVKKILDNPDVIIEANCNALDNIDCLFYSVMREFEIVQEMLRIRNGANI